MFIKICHMKKLEKFQTKLYFPKNYDYIDQSPGNKLKTLYSEKELIQNHNLKINYTYFMHNCSEKTGTPD